MKNWLIVLVCLSVLFSPALAQETAPQDEPVITRTSIPVATDYELVPVLDGLRRPLFVTHAGDESGRLFILEQGGLIKTLDLATNNLSTFLDISALVANTSGYTERGLLGMAFHPDFVENGRFYVNYTDRNGSTTVARYRVPADTPQQADPASAEILLTIAQPFANHNGGHMAFGPDGYLYIASGDGGGAGDPVAAGQNLNTLLGKILRIDVDGAAPYAIPPDNPFAGGGGSPEIWAYGLRNPWRFSFDRLTDDLYISDVGQNQWEEINFQPAGAPGGANYGWNVYEASAQYARGRTIEDVVWPIAEYSHQFGCSVTGGYVYRGQALADLQGLYFFGDYCSGNVWIAYRTPDMTWQNTLYWQTGMQVSSFGEDEQGEIYIVDYRGGVYRISAR